MNGLYLGGSENLFNFREVTSINHIRYPDVAFDFHFFVPARMKPLYEQIRHARYALSGYNPLVHSKLLSSNIYQSIVSLIVSQVTAGGVKLDGKNTDFLFDLTKKIGINDILREACYLSEGLGWSYLKLDIIKGMPKISAISNDQAYISDKLGEVVEYNGVSSYISSTKAEQPDIFLVEKRYFKDNVPYIKYDLYSTTTQYDSGAGKAAFDNCDSINPSNLDLEEIKLLGFNSKKEIRDVLKEKRLPFKGLGVSILKSSAKNPLYMKSFTSLSNFNKIGIDALIKYDTVFSAEVHEVSTSTRMIMTPQDMAEDNKNNIIHNQGILGYAQSMAINSRPIQHSYMLKLPYDTESGESAKPEAVEFKIRSAELSVLKGNAIADIALAIGFDKDDVANIKSGSQYEKGGRGEKTSKTIEEKRGYISTALKCIIDEIMFLYNIEENVDVIWLGLDFNLLEKQSTIFTTLVNSKLMSIRHALKKLYPNLSQEELEEEYKNIIEDSKLLSGSNETGFNEHNMLIQNKNKIKKGEYEND